MSLFTLDPGLALWTWIAFLALFVVLSRYVFPKMLASLKERENLIAKSVDDAQAIKQHLADANAARESLLQQTRNEADALLRQTREEAEVLRGKLAQKAEAEAEAIIKQARERIAEDRQAAVQALTDELAVFVCQTAEKVVGKSFTDDTDRAWARELAAQL